MKQITLILLYTGFCCFQLPAQDAAANRRKVIGMVLSQSHSRVNADKQHTNTFSPAPAVQNTSQRFCQLSAIPRYCLPKGAIVCRLEEYVQLHSPFKLNIGVGGE